MVKDYYHCNHHKKLCREKKLLASQKYKKKINRCKKIKLIVNCQDLIISSSKLKQYLNELQINLAWKTELKYQNLVTKIKKIFKQINR